MEPETPKAALTIDVNAEPATPRSVGGMPSPGAARTAKKAQSNDAEKDSEASDKQKAPTSPGGYGKLSSDDKQKPAEEKKDSGEVTFLGRHPEEAELVCQQKVTAARTI